MPPRYHIVDLNGIYI